MTVLRSAKPGAVEQGVASLQSRQGAGPHSQEGSEGSEGSEERRAGREVTERMSIYEDASDAEKGAASAELVVPDYTDSSGGGEPATVGSLSDTHTHTHTLPLCL